MSWSDTPRAGRRMALAAVGLCLSQAACVTAPGSDGLRGRVGEIRRQVEQIESQQRKNLDSVRDLEPPARPPSPEPSPAREAVGTAAPAPVSGAAPAPAGDAGGEGLYREAYALYHRGDFAAAERALRSFLRAHPGSPLADNARYWIGESFFARRRFAQAIAEFREVLDRHPAGSTAAHAQYRIALCHLNLGRKAPAREALVRLLESYPESDVAPLARQRLKDL